MSELRAALEGLLTHPGWHLFKQEARRRWGPEGYARELKLAVSRAIETNQSAESAVRIVDRVNDEVNSLLTWVETAAKHVAAQEARDLEPASVSRRGPNL